MKNSIIKFEDVSFKRGEEFIFQNISFDCYSNETVAIVGVDGCGKGAILKAIVGLLYGYTGQITVLGKNLRTSPYIEVQDLKKRIGYVFEEFALINNLSAFENIALPLRYHTKYSEEKIRDEVTKIIKLLDIEKYKDLRPAFINSTTRKLVGLGRAIILKPEILIFDKINIALNLYYLEIILKLVTEFEKETNGTIIYTTDDLNFAKNHADKIVILHDQRIQIMGSKNEIDQFNNPELIKQL